MDSQQSLENKDCDSAVHDSISCLKFAVPDATSDITQNIFTERQKIWQLKEEQKLVVADTELLHSEASKSYENIRVSHKQFTRIREICANLKQSNELLEQHLTELTQSLTRENAKEEESRKYFDMQIAKYQEKWEEYCSVYWKHPLVPQSNAAQRRHIEVEEYLKCTESQLRQLQAEIFKIKCERSRKTTKENEYYPLQNFVVLIAQLRSDTTRIRKEISEISKEISALKLEKEKLLVYQSKKHLLLDSEKPNQRFTAPTNVSASSKMETSEKPHLHVSRPTLKAPMIKIFIPKYAPVTSTSKDNSASFCSSSTISQPSGSGSFLEPTSRRQNITTSNESSTTVSVDIYKKTTTSSPSIPNIEAYSKYFGVKDTSKQNSQESSSIHDRIVPDVSTINVPEFKTSYISNKLPGPLSEQQKQYQSLSLLTAVQEKNLPKSIETIGTSSRSGEENPKNTSEIFAASVQGLQKHHFVLPADISINDISTNTPDADVLMTEHGQEMNVQKPDEIEVYEKQKTFSNSSSVADEGTCTPASQIISEVPSPFNYDKHLEILREMKKSPKFNYTLRHMFPVDSKKIVDQEKQQSLGFSKFAGGDGCDDQFHTAFYEEPVNSKSPSSAIMVTSSPLKSEEFSSFCFEKYCDTPITSTGTERSLFNFGSKMSQSQENKTSSVFQLFGDDEAVSSAEGNKGFSLNFGSVNEKIDETPQSSFKFIF